MIGRLYEVVIDCPDPRALATFYAALTGLEVTYEEDDWVTLGQGDGVRVAFRRVADHRPPQWPDPAYPQSLTARRVSTARSSLWRPGSATRRSPPYAASAARAKSR
jgi:hypothetical protein